MTTTNNEHDCGKCEHISLSRQYCTKLTSLLGKPFVLVDLSHRPKKCPIKEDNSV